MRLASTLLAVTLSGLAACTPVVSLTYTPTRAIVPGPPSSVAVVTAEDRLHRGSHVLLAVPGPYGFRPIAETHRPVADEVAAVFTKALQTRGMIGDAAPHSISLTLYDLGGEMTHDSNGIDGPLTDMASASIWIDLAVTDQSGRTVFKDAVQDSRLIRTLSSARDDGRLPVLVVALLNATVDRMLDNPAFRTAIQHH